MKSKKRNRKMKCHTLIIGTFLFSFLNGVALQVHADEEKEKMYLVQALNQLNEIQPILIAASKEQPNNQRIVFHYHRYTDNSGKQHSGLLDDIGEIKKGIEEKINQVSVEPRIVMPIKNDYLKTSTEPADNKGISQ